MSEKPDDQINIRKYLLGMIERDAERESFELRLMTDDAFFEELMFHEEDLIQDYVDGELDAQDRRAFEKNFLITDEAREKLKFARIFRKYVDEQPATNPPEPAKPSWLPVFFGSFSQWRLPAAAAALILGLIFAGWFFLVRSNANQRTTAALNQEYSRNRPFESRITDLKYAPFDMTRGAVKESEPSILMEKTERDLRDEALDHPSSRSHHAFGRFYLAEKNFDKAIVQLEKARDLSPKDAQILSDLGTAYLEKSNKPSDGKEEGQQLKLRAMAFEEFEKALEIDPKLLEALFNKALCLEYDRPLQARQAWQAYLNLDSASGWADDARNHVKALDEKVSQVKDADELLQDFMAVYRARDDEKAYQIVSRNREMITGKLIPQRLVKLFLETEDFGSKAEYLEALEYVGKLENEKSGDPFFSEMAKFYSTSRKEVLVSMHLAQEAVFRGYDKAANNNYGPALEEFRSAQTIFETAGNKWDSGICSYWIGYLLYSQSSILDSTAILEAARQANGPYKWLTSQYLNWLGYNMVAARELSRALEYNKESLILIEQTGDLYLSQKALSQQTQIYRRLGKLDLALTALQENLRVAQASEASLRQTGRDLDNAAGLFFSMNLVRTAASLENEALNLTALHLNEKTFEAQSKIRLGIIYGAQDRYTDAFAVLDGAAELAAEFPDAQLREKSMANIQMLRAHLNRKKGNCAEALTQYDDALTFYDVPARYVVEQYDTHKGRLLCYLKNNNSEYFDRELPVILELFRDYRTKIIEEANRNTFFENEQDVYDITVGYEWARGNFESAFNYSEESRARSLLDMRTSPVEIINDKSFPEIKFSAAVTEPLKLAEIQQQLPENVQVVQYSVLSDKTLIWLITRNSLNVFSSEIPATDLKGKALEYSNLVGNHNAAEAEKAKSLAKDLYRLLLAPVDGKLDPAKQVSIIPDKALFRLPFSALISPDTGKYFLTEYEFVSSPSLNIFLNATQRAALLESEAGESILAVGNPEFSEKDFPKLKSLESAGIEAEKVATIYGGKSALTGKNATKEEVLKEMPGKNMIHFGGHYIVNEGSPLLSGFVLSENPDTHKREDSILANYEIRGEKLSDTRLIVLAACETGVEDYYDGEGMIGASRTFLARGVPLVVASQWAVDTKATAEIMVRFHIYRKEANLSTAAALRRAQLDMLEGDSNSYRDPYYWAGFVTFGGYAQF